jgi:glycosyltransferase involved in cell wall biosynthesis
LTFNDAPGEYFAFLGRISPEKRVDRAIAIARATGTPIRIAAKVDPADQVYFDCEIKPLLDDPLVEFIGEIGERDKSDFLGHAKALLFPIDWPEPFGLVMIEALACGTPVVAFRHGSVPEILDDGRTGFVVSNMDEAIAAARRIDGLSRQACRREFERRFTVAHMAAAYTRLYRSLLSTASTNRVA